MNDKKNTMKFTAIIALALFTLGTVLVSSCGENEDEEKDEGKKTEEKAWPESIRNSFLETCTAGLVDNPEIDAKEYCDCVLHYMMKDYPNPEDVTKAMGQVMQYANGCK
jgi:hypothetical protein